MIINSCSTLIKLFLTIGAAAAAIEGPLTSDFVKFLEKKPRRNNYILNVIKKYGNTGSYGGRESEGEQIVHRPVVFIHGNQDSALDTGAGEFASGWNRQIAAFRSHGYSTAELYAISYGERDIMKSLLNNFNCPDLIGHRRFIEAVLQYTNSEKIDIIGHSMGVSIARRVIRGGKFDVNGTTCHLGHSLSHRVNVIVGISGANYGMCLCEQMDVNACHKSVGYFPGTKVTNSIDDTCTTVRNRPEKVEYSTFLKDINEAKGDEADHIVSLWSADDPIVTPHVWGRLTPLIPKSDFYKVYHGLSHMEMKTETVHDQLNIVRKLRID